MIAEVAREGTAEVADNNFIMTNDTSNNRWNLSYDVDTGGYKVALLKTNGTFLDKDILVNIFTPTGNVRAEESVVELASINPFILVNAGDIPQLRFGITQTQPTGTVGVDYLIINPTAESVSALKFNTNYIVSEGYVRGETITNQLTNLEGATILPGTPYYMPIVKPTISGGALSGSTTTEIEVTGMNVSDSTTDYYIDATATGSASRTTIAVSNQGGAIARNSIANVSSASMDVGSTADRVYIPAASVSVTASKAATAPTATKITSGTGNVIGFNNIVQAAPTSGYFVGFIAGAPATTLTPTKTLTTAGYISSNTQITASASTTASSKEFYIPITTGVASADASSAAVSLNTSDGSANGYNISASVNTLSDSEPTSGPYVAVTYSGGGNSKVTTAGWFPTGSLSTASTGNKIKYIPLKAATVTPSYSNSGLSTYFNTGSSSNYNVSITPQYSANQKGFLNSTSGNGTAGYWSIKTTSISQGTSLITDGALTRGTASWNTGWITQGSIPAATFANTATGSADNYLDISNTTGAPVLISGDYLYINKGYTDNLKISLAKLVPDFNTTDYPKIAAAAHMRQGYVAYNQDGEIITGTIQDLAGGNKYATTSDQTISCNGKYMTSDIVIKKLTQTNYTAANIKSGVTITVNNSNENVYSVAGTFTSASTVSSGQTAATASQMLVGYSAWVNGAEVKGNIPTITPSFDGGGLTVGSTLNQSNVTLSTSNTSGISVSSTGNATRAAVLYNGAAKGYINQADNAQALAAISTAVQQASPTTRYITALTLPKDKTLSVTTSNDTALDETSDLDITNGAYRRTDVVNNAYGTVLVNNAGTTQVTSNANNAGTLIVDAYNGTTLEEDITVVSAGKWNSHTITPGASAQGPYYGRVTVEPMSAGTAAVLNASGTASATTTVAPGTVSIAAETTTLSGKTQITSTPTTGTISTTYYIAAKATAAANSSGTTSSITGTASAGVTTAGYAAKSLTTSGSVTGTATAKTSAKSSDVYYFPIVSASGFSLNITAASGSSDVSVGTLASGKYPITANNLSVTGTLSSSTNGYFTSGSATDSDVDGIVVGKMNAAAITLSGNGALNGKTASAAFTGITTATTDDYNNGLLVQSKGTAGRAAVTYTNTAGYIPEHTSAQTLSSAVSVSTWNGAAYYLKGVTLTAPSTGERQFDITVPNGTSDTITFHFHVDANSNVYVD